MQTTYRIAQLDRSEPIAPNTDGLRTYGEGSSSAVSVTGDGEYVYASTIYWVFAVVIVFAIIVGFFLKRARVPA